MRMIAVSVLPVVQLLSALIHSFALDHGLERRLGHALKDSAVQRQQNFVRRETANIRTDTVSNSAALNQDVPATPLAFSNLLGVASIPPNSLLAMDLIESDAIGAYSSKAMEGFPDHKRGVHGKIHTVKRLVLGLHQQDTMTSISCFEQNFAFRLVASDKSTSGYIVTVYENGQEVIRGGEANQGDVLQISVDDINCVEYIHNGRVLYISSLRPQYPILVGVGFEEVGAELEDLGWVDDDVETLSFRKLVALNVTQSSSATSLSRDLSAGGLPSIAISKDKISRLFGTLRGFAASFDNIFGNMWIGLTTNVDASSRGEVDFAIALENRRYKVYEGGSDSPILEVGDVQPKDVIRVDVDGDTGKIIYRAGGKVLYARTVDKFPLFAAAGVDTGNFTYVKWIKKGDVVFPERINFVRFKYAAGVRTSPGGVAERITEGQGWTAGIRSESYCSQHGQGLIGNLAYTTNALWVGLSSVDNVAQPISFANAQFAILANASRLDAFENGEHMRSGPEFSEGDEIRLLINGKDRVDYLLNGVNFYTSMSVPTYPSYAYVFFYEMPTKIMNLRWAGDVA